MQDALTADLACEKDWKRVIRLVAKFSEHSEGRIRRWKAPDIQRINWNSTILNGHNKDEKWRTRCETTINLHDFWARNFSVRPGKPDLSEFSRPGRKPDKYRASRPCMQSSRKSSKILESGWKWIENALSGLRIGQNEPQDHDESNGTPPDPKYRSRKFKIPLKSEISEIQKCPLNLSVNRIA